MHSTNLQYSAQKFKVKGFKLFDGSLNRLKMELETSQPISSSAIAVYIGLHGICNPDGTLETDFTISKLAKLLKIPYSTAHTGFFELVDRLMVKEILVGTAPAEQTTYEIAFYAENNRTKLEAAPHDYFTKFSYFRVPAAVYETSVLSNLVKHKDRKGLMLFLELCNGFSRELRKKKENMADYTMPRTMKYLKRYLNRSAKRVRTFMDNIAELFDFTTVETVRTANESRLTRIRQSVQQLVVSKFTIGFKDICLVENDDKTGLRQVEAKMKKDAMVRLKQLGYALPSKEKRGLYAAFHAEIVSIAKWMEDPHEQYKLLTYTMQDALSQIEQYIKATGKRIDSVGALMRRNLRESWKYYKDKEMDLAVKHEIKVAYSNINGEYPNFI